jgi:Ca2+-binding EF-hand superfamily protein
MTSVTSATTSYSLQQLQHQQRPKPPSFKDQDANNDGKVDRSEFVATKPKGMSEDDAGSLFDKLDSQKSGALSESDLKSAFQTLGRGMKSTLLQAQADQSGGDDPLADLFKTSDADGDGKVTRDEFVASRPKDASEDQAGSLFDQLDSESSGSLTLDQMKTGMEKMGPPPGGPPPGGPPPGGRPPGGGSDPTASTTSTSTSTSTSSTDTTQSLLDQLLEALKSGTDSSEDDTSSAAAGSASTRQFLASLLSYQQASQSYGSYGGQSGGGVSRSGGTQALVA